MKRKKFENKTVVESNDLTVSDPEFNFVGTYTAYVNNDSPIAQGDMIAGEKEFVKANGGNNIKAYRAYLRKVGTSNAKVSFAFDDEVIDGIKAEILYDAMTNGDIFNINGQKVNSIQKGVYIINGKKVVVK